MHRIFLYNVIVWFNFDLLSVNQHPASLKSPVHSTWLKSPFWVRSACFSDLWCKWYSSKMFPKKRLVVLCSHALFCTDWIILQPPGGLINVNRFKCYSMYFLYSLRKKSLSLCYSGEVLSLHLGKSDWSHVYIESMLAMLFSSLQSMCQLHVTCSTLYAQKMWPEAYF